MTATSYCPAQGQPRGRLCHERRHDRVLFSSQAVLRILGTGVAPFDDARRAALASALQADLADVAAGDVAILTACHYNIL